MGRTRSFDAAWLFAAATVPNNPVLSAVGTGVIWGYWHFPAAIRGYSYPANPIIGALIMYPIFGIVLSIIFGWLVQKTGKRLVIQSCSRCHRMVLEGDYFYFCSVAVRTSSTRHAQGSWV